MARKSNKKVSAVYTLTRYAGGKHYCEDDEFRSSGEKYASLSLGPEFTAGRFLIERLSGIPLGTKVKVTIETVD